MTIAVKNILDTVLQIDADWRLQLFTAWPQIVGSLKTHVRLEKIKDDMVIVGVYESHWMQELFLLSRVLIASINKQLQKPYINHIRFRLIEQQKTLIKKQRANVPDKKAIIPELAKKELAALDCINDRQLRDALRDYYIRCLENNAC